MRSVVADGDKSFVLESIDDMVVLIDGLDPCFSEDGDMGPRTLNL